MKGEKAIIDILNTLLTGELTAVDQYLIHGEIYADMGFGQLATKALHESEHERQHARALIQRILFLEGTPELHARVLQAAAAWFVDGVRLKLSPAWSSEPAQIRIAFNANGGMCTPLRRSKSSYKVALYLQAIGLSGISIDDECFRAQYRRGRDFGAGQDQVVARCHQRVAAAEIGVLRQIAL